MRRQARATRVLRGATAACLATFVALLSHVSGGGAVPGWVGVAVPLALSFVGCTALAGRRLSAVRLSVAVVLSHVFFHTLFVLGSYDVGVAGHVHGGRGPFLMPGSAVPALAPDAAMWGGHLLAAVITVVALHRGERTIASLRLLAVRSVAWLRVWVGVILASARPVPIRRVFADVIAPVRPVAVLLAATTLRRGPPVTAS